jgi:putative endonuclease
LSRRETEPPRPGGPGIRRAGPSTRQRGQQAEAVAAAYLVERGLRLRATNYRCPLGEIDIVAEDGETLCFVEVRSRAGLRYGAPVETVGPAKQRRIVSVARHYLMSQGVAGRPLRFDVVSVVGSPAEAKQIDYFPDAFQVGGVAGGDW